MAAPIRASQPILCSLFPAGRGRCVGGWAQDRAVRVVSPYLLSYNSQGGRGAVACQDSIQAKPKTHLKKKTKPVIARKKGVAGFRQWMWQRLAVNGNLTWRMCCLANFFLQTCPCDCCSLCFNRKLLFCCEDEVLSLSVCAQMQVAKVPPSLSVTPHSG